MARRSSSEIDVVPFRAVIIDAMQAFSEDSSYATAMARQASAIRHKRQVWLLRLEIRKAESEARTQCEASEPFVCSNASPCGLGGCRFATPEHGKLCLVVEGDTERPAASQEPAYDLEASLPIIQQLRGDREPA